MRAEAISAIYPTRIGRFIPSRPGFMAHSDGRIFNLKTWRFMKAHPNHLGYLAVFLYTPKRYTITAHRLVCEAFHGEPPPGAETAHNNGVRDDNRPENLRWATHRENVSDRAKHGTDQSGEDSPFAKLTTVDVLLIRAMPKRYGMFAAIGRRYGISQNTARLVWIGKKWKHLNPLAG